MTRATMKSYCKVVVPAYGAKAIIDFNDSAGNLIDCNFISVDCRSEGSDDLGFFIAQPSGIYTTELAASAQVIGASGTGNHNTSGMGGVIGTADGSIEMSLNSTQKAQGLILWNWLKGTTQLTATFVITYGNMKRSNPKRDQDDAFFPPGL